MVVKGEEGWVTKERDGVEVRRTVEYELLDATGKEESASGRRMEEGREG